MFVNQIYGTKNGDAVDLVSKLFNDWFRESRSMSSRDYECLIHKVKAAAQERARNALLAAAFTGDVSIVEELLEAGADVNLQNEHGDSALHFAINGIALPDGWWPITFQSRRRRHEAVVSVLLVSAGGTNSRN